MKKEQKIQSIELAKQLLSENDMCILLDYKGLTAADVDSLRNSLKDKQSNIKVLKNTLVKKAIESTNLIFLNNFLKEQVAIAYSKDPLTLSGVIMKFITNNDKLQIKAGFMNGEQIDIKQIERLSKLGSINDVRAKFISVLRAPTSQLVRVMDAYAKKDL